MIAPSDPMHHLSLVFLPNTMHLFARPGQATLRDSCTETGMSSLNMYNKPRAFSRNLVLYMIGSEYWKARSQ